MALKTFIAILMVMTPCAFGALSTYVGNFIGNGSGLTNVPGRTNWSVSSITNAGTAAYSNSTAFALAQSGTIVTQNNSFSLVLSNTAKMDAAHALSLSNLIASRIVLSGADNGLTSAAASGAVPVDADGSATTFAQVNALAPGFVSTNNNANAEVIFTNNGVSLGMNSSGIFTLTNYAAANLGFVFGTNGGSTNSGNFQAASETLFASTPSSTAPSALLSSFSAGGSVAGTLSLAHSRNTTIGSFTTSVAGDTLGILLFQGVNGTPVFETAGQIQTIADAVTSGHVLGRMEFYTATNGAVLNKWMQLESTGDLRHYGSNLYSTSITATNGFLMPTNYVAANFTPVAGMVKICSSNGVLWKVTQLSTNLLSSTTP